MWSVDGGEAASRRPQRLPGKSEVPKGGTPSDCPSGTWPDGSSATLRTKTDFPGRGELDVENMERRDTYLGTGGIHIRYDTTRILHGRHKRTNNAYRP